MAYAGCGRFHHGAQNSFDRKQRERGGKHGLPNPAASARSSTASSAGAYPEKNEIVGALRLVDDEDTKLIDVERFKIQLMRAKERNQLDALEETISRIEVGS